MLLHFSYEMQDGFSQNVRDHHFSLMCIPRDTNRQRVIETNVAISPCSYKAEDTDFFGNRIIYGEAIDPHDSFSVKISGTVETGLAPEEHRDTEQNVIFGLRTPLTAPGEKLRALYAELEKEAPAAVYDRAVYYMNAVGRLMEYVPGSTSVLTGAEGAAREGRGVCQDYAHILISLLRMAGIPARYCVGMMTGEGASHAWAEAFCRGYWYGFDPVNGLLVDSSYIKLSHGRDYTDCIVNKGVFRGSCIENKTVSVSVAQIDNNGETDNS